MTNLCFRNLSEDAENNKESYLPEANLPTSVIQNTYSDFKKHIKAHKEFEIKMKNNSFGHSCSVCDRLWFQSDLKNINESHKEILKTIAVIILFTVYFNYVDYIY